MKNYQELQNALSLAGRKVDDFSSEMEIAESNWDAEYGQASREENMEQFLDWCLENWVD